MFLSGRPSISFLDRVDTSTFSPDEFQLGDGVIYVRLPNGAGQTKIFGTLTDKRLEVRTTARNWNTVRRLANG